MKTVDKSLYTFLLITCCLSIYLYVLTGYHTERIETNKLITSYGILFIAFISIMFNEIRPLEIFVIGLIFRLIFIISLPTLSQDFYRFIWDGNLQLEGINPYLYSPNDLIHKNNLFYLANYLLIEYLKPHRRFVHQMQKRN